jgi:acyl dehydratase
VTLTDGLAAAHQAIVGERSWLALSRPLAAERCAMIPLRDQALATGRQDDLTAGQREIDEDELLPLTAGWTLTRPALPIPAPGTRLRVEGRDTVSSGPELARLTMNIAAVHHDAAAAGGRRLVYGGHTIALALTQATRAIPNLLTVLAWHSCDHTAPVHEGDMLSSVVEVERVFRLAQGGALAPPPAVTGAGQRPPGARGDPGARLAVHRCLQRRGQ